MKVSNNPELCDGTITNSLFLNHFVGQHKAKKNMYYLYLDVNSLTKAGASSTDDECGDLYTGLNKDFLQFSQKELYGIRTIAESPEVFRLLVHSLCPPIFGHNMVKGEDTTFNLDYHLNN